MTARRPATLDDLMPLAAEVGPRLLDAVLTTTVDGETVAVRITEVEAYHGRGSGDVPDPGSHARMGRTERNATMWGEAGHLYVYLSHGIHSCVNVVCGPEGRGDGCLLRAGEIVYGREVALRRRSARGVVRADRDLARGPGRLGDAIGLRHPVHDGIDALGRSPGSAVPACATPGVRQAPAGAVPADVEAGDPPVSARLELRTAPLTDYASGPRVGVAGVAGTAAFPWRFWIPGDPAVSPFRPGRGA